MDHFSNDSVLFLFLILSFLPRSYFSISAVMTVNYSRIYGDKRQF